MKRFLLAAAAIIAAISNASAETADLRFRARIETPESCTIVVGREGELVLAGTNELTAYPDMGGTPATAIVTASHDAKFRVTLHASPAFVTAPPNVTATFNPFYQLSGATIKVWESGAIPALLNKGDTDVAGSLRIRSAEPFPSGDYEAVATLTCE